MNILSCQDLSVQYDRQQVLRQVSFSIQAGDYLCIVGENGSGKSTLLKSLLGLVPIQTGQVSLACLPHEIGYLPQQSAIQRDFPASVTEVVRSGCLSRGGRTLFPTKEQKRRADKAIRQLQLDSVAQKSYRNLSGGQQQRVLLARALCAAQKVLFLDEPVANLDPLAARQLYDLIHRLHQEKGLTVVMVSHDLSAAVSQATHILHLERSPRFFGTTQDYLKTEEAKRILGKSR